MNPVYGFDEKVKIACSGEKGVVIGYAQYKDAQDQALVRYKSGDGRAVETWWSVSALEIDDGTPA